MVEASSSGSRRSRRGRPLLRGLLIALVVLLALLLPVAPVLPHLYSLAQQARALQQIAAGGPKSLNSAEGLATIRQRLGHVQQDLQAIQSKGPHLLWLAAHLSWLPGVGGDLAAAQLLLRMSIPLCEAAGAGLEGMEPLLGALGKQQQGGSAIEAALPALAAGRESFARAEESLAQARAIGTELDGLRLSPWLARWVDRLDRYLPMLEAGMRLLGQAPELLGEKRTVTYLLLAQNSHELRATGGFISGVGVISISQGQIVASTFQDSYRVDGACPLDTHPPAPAALRRYMWAPVLTLRDANWSPDFVASAEVAASIYRSCSRGDVDGVIAIDLDGASQLLSALGPLQPEGYPEPVTGKTLSEYVSQFWTDPLRSGGFGEDKTWWAHRKDFMGDLLKAGLQKVTSRPQDLEPRRLAGTLLDALQGRHLLVYLREPKAAQALARAGWDGALLPAEGDSLMVVDSNLGYRKVNPSIRQTVEYQVEPEGQQGVLATLTLRYRNVSSGAPECVAGSYYDNTYEEMMQGCYWDYVRIYVPRGSRLLAVTGSDREPEISEEAGRAVFSAFIALPAGRSRELVFRYELPARVLSAGGEPQYRLFVQKQPGSADTPVQVRILGRGWELLTASPAGARAQDGQVALRLATDVRLDWARVNPLAARLTSLQRLLGVAGALAVLSAIVLLCLARPLANP